MMSIQRINQNMVSIRTRGTFDTFPLSIIVPFGEIQATPLGSQEQVLRPLLVVDPENPENELELGGQLISAGYVTSSFYGQTVAELSCPIRLNQLILCLYLCCPLIESVPIR